MDNHDLDLISALAAGSLPAVEAAALESRISSDPAAMAELAAQRRAFGATSRAARPQLADTESIALRTAVASRLGLEPGAAPRKTRRRVPWGAVAVGASTLAAIIALAPVVGLVGDRDGGDSAMTVADVRPAPAGDDAGLDAATLGADAPPGDGDNTTIAPAAAGEEFASTTQATAFSERASDSPKVAQDLALLASDPEAVQLLEQPTEETTSCRTEAESHFAASDLTWFEYPEATENGATMVWVVFHLAAPDGGTGMLVAFDPADCATAIEVPQHL